jgi:ubiquinone/menaquinone biosynthesis C-methylase UbiE
MTVEWRRLFKSRSTLIALVLAVASLAAGGYLLADDRWQEEAERLLPLLELDDGAIVAEVGAGDGELTVEIARRLPASGRVFSTELSSSRLDAIRRAVKDAGLENVDVREAKSVATGLPDACCDAIVMRDVYHHITDPAAYNPSLRRTLKDGGILAIIDFEPGGFMRMLSQPEGTPKDRGGHGMPRDVLKREMTSARFTHLATLDDWPGRNYLMLFRAIPSMTRGGRP